MLLGPLVGMYAVNCISIPLDYILHKYSDWPPSCSAPPPPPPHPPPLGEAGGGGVGTTMGGGLEGGEEGGEEGEVVDVPQM